MTGIIAAPPIERLKVDIEKKLTALYTRTGGGQILPSPPVFRE